MFVLFVCPRTDAASAGGNRFFFAGFPRIFEKERCVTDRMVIPELVSSGYLKLDTAV